MRERGLDFCFFCVLRTFTLLCERDLRVEELHTIIAALVAKETQKCPLLGTAIVGGQTVKQKSVHR